MRPRFVPISREQAIECVDCLYEAPYAVYNVLATERAIEVEGMLNPESKTFAVLDGDEFSGVRSFGADGRVDGGVYDESHQDTGGALRPDLTGKGLGESILKAGLQFGRQDHGFTGYRVTVAAFNARALKVCQGAGFVERQRFARSADEMGFVILTLGESIELGSASQLE